MKLIKPNDINQIVELLKQDNVLVFLTDTVYGLMARASKTNQEKLNTIKQALPTKTISLVMSSKDQARVFGKVRKDQEQNFESLLPGKVTLIIKAKRLFKKTTGLNYKSIGVRITTKANLQEVATKLGFPILATSANITKHEPCKSIAEIKKVFGNIDNLYVVNEELNTDNKSSSIYDLQTKTMRKIR